jgi:hypothetical protein
MDANDNPNKNMSNSISIPLDDDLYNKSHNATKDLIQSLEQITNTACLLVTNQTNNDKTNNNKNDITSLQLVKSMKSIPHSFLTLKENQRSICQNVGLHLQSSIQNKRKDVESQSLLLQNLIYEKSHLEREIRECERGFENVFLLKMAKDELGLNTNTNTNTNTTDGDDNDGDDKRGEDATTGTTAVATATATAATAADNDATNNNSTSAVAEDEDDEEKTLTQNDNLINTFLKQSQSQSQSYSYRDPKQHNYTLSKLHKEGSQRGILQNELTKASKRKLELMSSLKEQNEFIKSIPKQIQKLEEWSIPLQEYFTTHYLEQIKLKKKKMMEMDDNDDDNDDDDDDDVDNSLKCSAGVGGVESLIGSERRMKLRHAQDLPSPLYTLFVQFQSFLDAHCTSIHTSTSSTTTTTTTGSDDKKNDFKMDIIMDDLMMNDIYDWKLCVIDTTTANATSTAASTGNKNKNVNATYSSSDDNQQDIQQDAIKSIDTIVTEYTQPSNKAIQLWIPLPNNNITLSQKKLSSSKNKNNTTTKMEYVKIQFTYFPKLQLVTAHVCMDGGSSNNQKIILDKLCWYTPCNLENLLLLQNLFDNDEGMTLPHVCALDIQFRLEDEEDDDKEDGFNENQKLEQSDNPSLNDDDDDEQMIEYDEEDADVETNYHNSDGYKTKNVSKSQVILDKIRNKLIMEPNSYKPYYWCQYLAGLHYPRKVENTDTSVTSTGSMYRIDPTIKSTIMRLRRRVRSHATLSAMIKSFMKKDLSNPIPVHPSMKDVLGENECNYKCRTKLERWSQDPNGNKESTGNVNTFYDVALTCKSKTLNARVEIDPRYPAIPPVWSLQPSCNGNDEEPLHDGILGELEIEVNTLKCLSKFLNGDIEDSFDWILMHQLRVVMIGWEKYQETLEKDKTQNMDSSDISNQRQRRGRDRRLIHSITFETFKYGL